MTDIRNAFIKEVRKFIEEVKTLDVVLRIAMIGSLVTAKSSPKDIDMLVTVTNEMSLSPLARLTRRMNGPGV